MTLPHDLIAKVIIDAPNLNELDYSVPAEMLVAPGDRVRVTLGSRKVTGIVTRLQAASDFAGHRLKSILQVMKDMPPLPAEWLALTQFAASYYIRGWGEAALSALPAFLRREQTVAQAKWLAKARAKKLANEDIAPLPAPVLNAEQLIAADAVTKNVGFQPWLLFGVTGSGKTEVYLQLISRTLARDPEAQVLLLVPEINLTPQLQARVCGRFPHAGVVAMHSEYSNSERAAAWLAVHEGRARILVGTRLSIFASFKKLSLVIVDEEHDLSYKAGDGLRYSARDLAVWRAMKNRCAVVLGSATPSLESWAKAKEGSYKLLRLTKRAAANAMLPEIELIAPKPRGSKGLISEEARIAIEAALAKGHQALVFLNRRGYAPVLSCSACGWVSACPRCSAFMVYHKSEKALICHHCGYRRPVPDCCPSCGNVDILPRGIGTERLEEEISQLFPGKRVLRIDRDTATKKSIAEEAFRKVHRGEVDILVGTQMIAKGHDFQNVAVVLILNADSQILSPNARAKEHLFATLMQVAGRSGRSGSERGLVLIQTRFPEEPLFAALAKQNYPQFADSLLEERRADCMVPFVHQALLRAEADQLSKSLFFLETAAKKGELLAGNEVRIYDPVPMALVRLMNKERGQLLVEADSRKALHRFLNIWVPALGRSSDVVWTLEVDPIET